MPMTPASEEESLHSDDPLHRWKNTWSKNQTPWQLDQANPILVKHYDKLFPSNAPARVLVPLCGKSLDMSFLWQKGHEVVGIEGVAAAVPAFEQESGIQMKADSNASGSNLTMHRNSDGRLTIVEADFFQVSHPSLDHQFTVVWDRASLYALPYDLRRSYLKTIRRLLAPDFRYLLMTIEYDDTLASGPPFNVSQSEVVELFGDFAEIERLEEVEIGFKLSKFEGMAVKEVVYLLTKRNS